jgi:hypothetical protein
VAVCGHVGVKQCSAAPPCSGKKTAVPSPTLVLEQLWRQSPSPPPSSSSPLLLSPLVQRLWCGHEVAAGRGGKALGHPRYPTYRRAAAMEMADGRMRPGARGGPGCIAA